MKCKNCNHLGWCINGEEEKFRWCVKINDCPDVDTERDCRHFEPKTNADWIRSLSDDELAVLIAEIQIKCARIFVPNARNPKETEIKTILDWLQEPAKEDF